MAITFEGLDDVLGKLDKVASPQKLERAMGTACALVEAAAKKKADKDSGALRRSITSEVRKEGDTIEGVVYTPLEYAPYREYGTGLFAKDGNGRKDVPWHYKDDKGEWHTTSGQKPHPFMRPALNENRENIKRLLEEGLTSD